MITAVQKKHLSIEYNLVQHSTADGSTPMDIIKASLDLSIKDRGKRS
jgi:hypothetical protein